MVNGLRERVRAAFTNIFIGWLLLTGFANARLFVCLFSFYLIPWPGHTSTDATEMSGLQTQGFIPFYLITLFLGHTDATEMT